MKYYEVEVIDRQTHMSCIVGSLLTFAEARQLERVLLQFNACDVRLLEFSFLRRKKGKVI